VFISALAWPVGFRRISCDTPAFAIALLKLCRKLWKLRLALARPSPDE